MIVLQLLILGILLFGIPLIVGTLFFPVDKGMKNLPLWWISGQMALWAGFELITVPLVLRKGKLTWVVSLFLAYMAALTVWALIRFAWKRRRKQPFLHAVTAESREQKIEKYIFLAVFWGLLAFQLIQALRLAYADGDDAYYVAVANLAAESDTMYQKSAYSGGVEVLDARYALAPFPLWISFLSRVSGIRTVSVAHVIVPPVLIAMTYGIFYLIGRKLFPKNKRHVFLFLIFTELLVIFGDYSFYTAERFMIARSRQGKAALGNLIIPMLIFLLLLLLERINENRKIPLSFWMLLTVTLTAACLCSSLGTLLACMLIGVTGLCTAVCYGRWKILLPLGACCIPCAGAALLYVLL